MNGKYLQINLHNNKQKRRGLTYQKFFQNNCKKRQSVTGIWYQRMAEMNADLHKHVQVTDTKILQGFKVDTVVGIVTCREKWKRFIDGIRHEKGKKQFGIVSIQGGKQDENPVERKMNVTVPFPLRQTGTNTLFVNIIFRHPNSFQSLFPKKPNLHSLLRLSVPCYFSSKCVVGKVYTYGNVPYRQQTFWNFIDLFCFGNQRQLSINIR